MNDQSPAVPAVPAIPTLPRFDVYHRRTGHIYGRVSAATVRDALKLAERWYRGRVDNLDNLCVRRSEE